MRRRGGIRPAAAILILLAAALLGAGSFLFPSEAGRASARGDVAVDAGARDPGRIDAHNSPTLVQNPRHGADLVVVDRVDTPAFTCGLHVSHDGGTTWASPPVPLPPRETRCYAPDASYGPDGLLVVSFVTLRGAGNTPGAVWVLRSRDAGRSFASPRRVAGPLAFQVRVAADPQRPGRFYLTWIQARRVGIYRFTGPGNPVVASASGDGGRSWGRPVRVSDASRGRVLAPAPAVGPDGALYVLYLDVGDDRLDYEGGHDGLGGPPYAGRFSLVLGRSADRGASWRQSLVDGRVVPARRFVSFLPPAPSLAIDPGSGRIYAAFEDGARRPADVHLWSLAPGAGRWSGPVRVNDTPAGDRTAQYLPKITVAPGGRLDVAYFDRRSDRANRRNEVSLQSSSDAGRSFSTRVVVSDRPSDSGIGAGSERGLPDLGSRLGLISGPARALVVWTDTRAGTVRSNKQDIAFDVATPAEGSGLSPAARLGLRALAVVLLLGAALGLGRRGAGRPRSGPVG